ncbi:hypothetical protein EIP86_006237 [Pleurotus ostreatoroseus]|nr:hypothetical protein EIP86_006237 [Pleurotus ostreatoroseus]
MSKHSQSRQSSRGRPARDARAAARSQRRQQLASTLDAIPEVRSPSPAPLNSLPRNDGDASEVTAATGVPSVPVASGGAVVPLGPEAENLAVSRAADDVCDSAPATPRLVATVCVKKEPELDSLSLLDTPSPAAAGSPLAEDEALNSPLDLLPTTAATGHSRSLASAGRAPRRPTPAALALPPPAGGPPPGLSLRRADRAVAATSGPSPVVTDALTTPSDASVAAAARATSVVGVGSGGRGSASSARPLSVGSLLDSPSISPQHRGASPPEIPSDIESESDDAASAAPLVRHRSSRYALAPSDLHSPIEEFSPGPAYPHTRDLSSLPPWDESDEVEDAGGPATRTREPTTDQHRGLSPVATPPSGAPPTLGATVNPERRPASFADRLRAARTAPPAPVDDNPQAPTAQFTPRPAEGFARIYRATSQCILDNTRLDQSVAWDRLPGFKLTVQAADHGANDLRPKPLDSVASAMLRAVRTFLGNDHARLARPQADIVYTDPNMPPYSSLIYNLNEDEADRLAVVEVLSSDDITIFMQRLKWESPGVLGVASGYDLDTTAEDVLRIARSRVEAIIPAILDATDDEEIVNATDRAPFADKIMKSLRVSRLDCKKPGAIPEPEFYIYADLPVLDHIPFQRIQGFLCRANWVDPFAGEGGCARPKPHDCNLCHGADHPRGLCPLPNTPGWRGPTHQERPRPLAPPPPRDYRPPSRGPDNRRDDHHKRRAPDDGRGDRFKYPRRY